MKKPLKNRTPKIKKNLLLITPRGTHLLKQSISMIFINNLDKRNLLKIHICWHYFFISPTFLKQGGFGFKDTKTVTSSE